MIRVLIADDHPVVLAGLSDLLGAAGCHVVAISRNGVDTLDAVRRERPDVLIVDLRMPVLDGIGVLRALSRDEYHPRTILLTAEAEGSEHSRALALGVDAVILKESALDQLVDCVRALVSGNYRREPLPELLSTAALAPIAREAIVLLCAGSSASQSAARLGISMTEMRSIVEQIAGVLGVEPDEFAVREACAALLGEHMPGTARARWLTERYGLTRREASVAALLADGLTNREIAEKLGITLNTVKTHISSIHAKVDVPSTRRLMAVLSEAREPER